MEYTPLSSTIIQKVMLIGELSEKSGFSRDTIRYYERIRLLSVSKRARRENNYKEYEPAILARLRAIRELKNIGYTLSEIQKVISSYEAGGLNCAVGKEQILEKALLIDQQISRLQKVKVQLLEAVANCPDECKITTILKDTLLCN